MILFGAISFLLAGSKAMATLRRTENSTPSWTRWIPSGVRPIFVSISLELTLIFVGRAGNRIHQHAVLLDSTRNRRTHLPLLQLPPARRSSLNSNSVAFEEHYSHHRRFGLHSRRRRSSDPRAGVQVNGRRGIELFWLRTGRRRILCRMRLSFMNVDACEIYTAVTQFSSTQRLLVLLLESSSSSLDLLGNLSSSSRLLAAFSSSDRSST